MGTLRDSNDELGSKIPMFFRRWLDAQRGRLVWGDATVPLPICLASHSIILS